MNLFVKIFLWFLAATALMVGVALFLTWSLQSDPFVNRIQTSARNQIRFHGETIAFVERKQGISGVVEYLGRMRQIEPVRGIVFLDSNGKNLLERNDFDAATNPVVDRARKSGQTEADFLAPGDVVIATPVTLSDQSRWVLAVIWSRPMPPPFLGEARVRYLRLLGLILTAILVCYVLARYLTSPIVKLGEATRAFADGDLSTRVSPRLGRRRDEFGKLAGDFDEMAERIETLLASEKRLTRDISHELRSPLARMNVALELAKKKAGPDAGPILDRIETEAERLNEMIAKILTLSKLENGAAGMSMVSVNLSKLVADIAADADFEANPKGKRVVTDIADDCRLTGNEYLLRSAVENVVRNAVRYTATGTEVFVRLAETGPELTVTVTDHGGGVPASEIENLFRPFYRVGEARERQSGGVGLGLAIARRAVAAHEGIVSASNTSDGLEVVIRLPRNDARR